MRTRLLLPAVTALALLPLPAQATPDTGGGIECSIGNVSVSPDTGEPYVTTVDALWVVENTSVTRMTLYCEASVNGSLEHTYSATSSTGPVLSYRTVASFSDTVEVDWCMWLYAYDANGSLVDEHVRCYIQRSL